MELEDFMLSECAAQVLVERVLRRAPSKKERKEAMLAPAIVSDRAIDSYMSRDEPFFFQGKFSGEFYPRDKISQVV